MVSLLPELVLNKQKNVKRKRNVMIWLDMKLVECNWIVWCKQFYCKTNHEKKVVKEGDGRSNSINGAIIGETLKLASTSPATKFPPLIVIFKDNTISFFLNTILSVFLSFFLHL